MVAALSLARYAKRRDANEPLIIAALRAAGCRVWALDKPFDLLVGIGGRFVVLEVKSSARRRKDQARQTTELEQCQAGGLPVYRVESAREALAALGMIETCS